MAFRSALVRSHIFDPKVLRPGSHYQRPAVESMQPLSPVFERLDLSVYTELFIENGFETWGDVLDITEHDL